MNLVVCLLLGFHAVGANTPPIVDIPSLGTVEGTVRTSYKGQDFFSFEGVPYARPPFGKYRFREPVPVKPWVGVWEAKTIYKCMQSYQYTPPGGDFVIGDEDCLYLNIYTPSLTGNFPVVVYIHGGAFMFNWGGIYQPDYIIDEKVVFVTLNYRLGPLGFLSTENDIVPGNNGLKDQILALQWVKENIAHFGGNPNSVTIFGMSAGGASVHFHYLSPQSRGLFHRGISQSGTMLNPWVLVEQPLQKTKKLAMGLGCDTNDVRRMVACLKRPARQIVESVKLFQPWLYNPFSPFGVVVDTWAENPVLPQHPYQLLKQKKIANLPWLASYTNSEGLYPAADFYPEDEYLNELETRWNEIVPFILDYNYTVDSHERDLVSSKIRQKYLGTKKITKETFRDFVKLVTDRIFTVDIEKSLKLHVKASTSPVYFYYFTYRGAHSKSESRAQTNEDFGAAHGDDTSYVLKMNVDTESTKKDREMIQLMTGIVGSFAKSGEPKVGITWSPVQNTGHVTYLHIKSPSTVVMANSSLDATFWESLPIRENEKLFVGVKDEL